MVILKNIFFIFFSFYKIAAPIPKAVNFKKKKRGTVTPSAFEVPPSTHQSNKYSPRLWRERWTYYS